MSYATISTSELIAELKDIPQLCIADRKTTHMRGTMHCVQVPIDTQLDIVGDTCLPVLLLRNSFNGECSLTLSVGLYRLVCSNGLVIGSHIFAQRVRHIEGQKLDTFLRTYKGTVQAVLSAVDTTLSSQLATAVSTQIAQPLQLLTKLVERKLITQRVFNDVYRIYRQGSFKREADAIQAYTVWGLWNVINESMDDTRTRRQTDGSILQRNDTLLPSILTTLEVAA